MTKKGEASRSTRYPSSRSKDPYLKGSKDISEGERKRYNKTKKRERERENKGRNSPLAKPMRSEKPYLKKSKDISKGKEIKVC